MALKVVKKPVVADVEVEKNKTVVSHEQVPVGVADVTGPVANVGFSAAYTKNLGNYESLKITVSLYMPVSIPLTPKDGLTETLDDTFSKVQLWVDTKINQVLDELDE